MNYLKTYLNELLDTQNKPYANQLNEDARKAQELSLFKETSTPLVTRLKKLIASIPKEEILTPRPLEWFRTRLTGVEGRGAHAGQLGLALRELKYVRRRSWSNSESGFRSLWYPTI
jgi:hypothetical protein